MSSSWYENWKNTPEFRSCKGSCGRIVTRDSSTGFCIHCFNKNRTGYKRPESFKKDQSKRITEWFQKNPQQRMRRSISMSRSWETGALSLDKMSRSCKSKVEQDFFEKLQSRSPFQLEQHKIIRFSNGHKAIVDIFVPRLGLVIEYYGDFWHANPNLHSHDKMIFDRTAKQVWDHDRKRQEMIEEQFTFLKVWQCDGEESIEKILRFWDWECDPSEVYV